MPKPYVIDFSGATLNDFKANDKLLPNEFVEFKNVLPNRQGRMVKRNGFTDLTSGTQLPSAEVLFIEPIVSVDLGDTAEKELIAYASSMRWLGDTNDDWTAVISGPTVASNAIFNFANGLSTNTVPSLYVATTTNGLYEIEGQGTPSATKIGSSSDASNPFDDASAVEYFLDKLWAGNVDSDSDRLYWSVTGDTNDFYSSGSGFIDMRTGGSGTLSGFNGIRGLRVYKNRLYIGTQDFLHVLTGNTSATFGQTRVTRVNNIIGRTMRQVGPWMFFVDKDGVWQFNGLNKIIVSEVLLNKWKDLSFENDILRCSATWDESLGYYAVFFPAVQEIWFYYYRTQQWVIWDTADGLGWNAVSSPITDSSNQDINFAIGSATSGKARGYSESTYRDDGSSSIITAVAKTGHVRLGEVNGTIGSRFTISHVDIETADQDAAGEITLTFTIDGTAQTAATLATADAGASKNTFPTAYDGDTNVRIDLGSMQMTGRYMQLEISDDDGNSGCDIRRITIWYNENKAV